MINLIELLEYIKDFHLEGDIKDIFINNAKSINEANENSIVWLKTGMPEELIKNTKSKLIVCDKNISYSDKCLIKVDNPKLVFINIVKRYFTEKIKPEIHSTVLIHPKAKIHHNVSIGPYTIIGKSEIGENSIIHGHCYIYDNVKIRKNVIIYAGCIIGIEGFGFERDENGKWNKFPHVGGVIIEDNVEIQGMTNVDRGTLGNTVIGKGTKIDTQCHIGHNNIIGEDTIITARTMLGGSNFIGNNCWISPCTTIRTGGIKIGNNSFIGTGSLIVKDVKENERVMGHPAKSIKK